MTTSGAKASRFNATLISCDPGQQLLEGRRVPVMMSGKSFAASLGSRHTLVLDGIFNIDSYLVFNCKNPTFTTSMGEKVTSEAIQLYYDASVAERMNSNKDAIAKYMESDTKQAKNMVAVAKIRSFPCKPRQLRLFPPLNCFTKPWHLTSRKTWVAGSATKATGKVRFSVAQYYPQSSLKCCSA